MYWPFGEVLIEMSNSRHRKSPTV